MRKIITLIQSKNWASYIKRSPNYDFYHSWIYHSLDESGIPILFVYEEGEDFIAIPLIKRKIPKTDLFDFTSVYGYCGPFANKCFIDFEESFMEKFKNYFLEFLKDENIVSIFSRLHPFFDQLPLLSKFGGVYDNGKVIYLDLTITLEEQRSRYQNRVFRQIKQLNKKGYVVRETRNLADIQTFHSIYIASMIRLDASKTYMFSEKYLVDLLHSKEINAKLFFVYNAAGDPICGAIVVFTNQIVQAHLLATNPDFYSESPAKFLTDEISIIARKLGIKYYNLGGGLGYKEDSLFNWKLGFSKLTTNYNSWRFIANPGLYNNILKEFGIKDDSTFDLFPLYRYGIQAAN
jgi:hypothetical protein